MTGLIGFKGFIQHMPVNKTQLVFYWLGQFKRIGIIQPDTAIQRIQIKGQGNPVF